jgi:hypothetical protein
MSRTTTEYSAFQHRKRCTYFKNENFTKFETLPQEFGNAPAFGQGEHGQRNPGHAKRVQERGIRFWVFRYNCDWSDLLLLRAHAGKIHAYLKWAKIYSA